MPVIALIAPSSLMNIDSIGLGLLRLLLILLLLFSKILRQLLRMLRWLQIQRRLSNERSLTLQAVNLLIFADLPGDAILLGDKSSHLIHVASAF